jgi:putative peptide zinc metalloprotease protein
VSKSLFSSSWYRVAGLKPRLRNHVKIHRQNFRRQIWYVMQDQTSGRFHRFSPSAYVVMSLMDGKRTVQEIWDQACSRLEEDVLTQDETIRLLAQLHRADVIQGDVPPDISEMTERESTMRRRKVMMSFLNPLMVRIPLVDPEKFLAFTFPLVRPLFSWFGLALYFAVVGTGVVLAAMHWQQLTENITDRILAAESLVLLIITYPFVKALHELGHGYAVKRWGGEVHEMGIMFLVFMPVPYVDASAAAAIRSNWRRALIGAAGIMVEMLLAAIALFIWLSAEPGLTRAFAFNVMLIGGVSTVLFNGNPLLRFDGYYVLVDFTEIPNLAQRSNRYLGYLAQRYLFGVKNATSPVTAPGERSWFFFYGIAAFCYRMFIMVAIVTFVASKFFVVGVVLAIWSVFLMYGVPLLKGLWFLLASPTLREHRFRALAVVGAVVAAIAGATAGIPAPYGTVTEGVVWMPGDSIVHARTEGLVAEVLARPNDEVSLGDPLIRMEEPFLAARVRVLESEVRELELRLDELNIEDRAGARIVEQRLRHARAELALNRQRFEDLIVRSPANGRFVLPEVADLPQRYVRKGQTLGYIIDPENPVIRVIVDQDVIDLVRQRTMAVQVRFPDRVWRGIPATIEQATPAATDELPSLALSTLGGGKIVMNPEVQGQAKALRTLFQLELRLLAPVEVATVGKRVHVRFDHGREAMASRAYRTLRQVFLKQFNV